MNNTEDAMWDDIQSERDCHLTRIKSALRGEIEAAGYGPSTEEMRGYIKGLKVALYLIENEGK